MTIQLVMKTLMQRLLSIRVRPYYIHQADLVQGTRHFHVSVERGLEILSGLRGHTTGLAVPYYMIDLPGGKGKVPVLPEGVQRQGDQPPAAQLPGRSGRLPHPEIGLSPQRHRGSQRKIFDLAVRDRQTKLNYPAFQNSKRFLFLT